MTRNITDQVYDALDGLLTQCRNNHDKQLFIEAVAEYATEDPRIEAILRSMYAEHFADNLDTFLVA